MRMRSVLRLRLCAPLILVAAVLLQVSAAVRAASPSLDLDVELDPATRRLDARAVVAPQSRDFRFDLHEALGVTSATADGRRLRAEVVGRDGAIRHWRVRLPAYAGSVRLEYGGVLPALDPGLSHRQVLLDLPPMASPEGSFLPAGSGWYPRPAPLFSYRVAVSVGGGQRAVVPGRLVSETLPAGGASRYRASFELARPSEGIDLMAGPWIVRELRVPRSDGEPLRLRTYFDHALDAEPGLAQGYLEGVRRYIERYAEEIGPYPFTEFSVVASPLPTGFGMPTLTYLGAQILRLPFIRESSLGHEVLHSWWGNGVYVDYAKGNWSEGLTTFMADYAYKEAASPEAARAMRLGWLRDFAAVPAEELKPLAAFRSRTHGAEAAVGYGKSAMLFVMLRDLIGNDAFARGIRAFWARQRFRVASWDDLREAFEHSSGQHLEAFFDQWLERAGGPRVSVAEAAVRNEGSFTRLMLTVEQGSPPYALHLPVALVYPGRTDVRWIDVDRRRASISLALERAPDGIRLDPEMKVWRMLDPAQLPPILRQWVVARQPRLVLASRAPEVREAVAALASDLFERPPQAIDGGAIARQTEPVLLAGLHDDVDAMLTRAGLPPRPANLTRRGSAEVWTVDRGASDKAAPPVAVISARDADALRALARPLPHYGAQSWVVFDGRRAIERGVWPSPGRLIPVRVER